MLIFFKYLIYFLILISILLFYFIFTPLGNANIYALISDKLSKKAEMRIEVKSLDITHYPQIRIVMNLQRKAKLTLWGYLDDAHVDMNYTLTSNCIASEHCQIDDNIAIQGDVEGPFTRLYITGKGTALDGQVDYHATKYTQKVKDLVVHMHDVNSTKLLHLLGQEALIQGKADANVSFAYMDNLHQKGSISYHVKDENFKGIPLTLHTTVHIEDMMHHFTIDVDSKALTLHLTKGTYNQNKKIAHASYSIDVQELAALEALLGYPYRGSFYAMGEVGYDKYITITGLSKSFGGMLDFRFKKDKLTLSLENVIFEDIMHLLSFPSLISASTTGEIIYHLIEKTLVVDTKLHHAHFNDSKLVHVIRKKSGVHMENEYFDNSKLELTYYENLIHGYLKLSNANSHIYLTSTKIDTTQNTINAYFDFKMQRQEFSGKIYGNLNDPKVNLNMQKLIRYQMDKQVDKMIGKNNRKIMEHMPMGGVAKDVATDMGASFMKVFF